MICKTLWFMLGVTIVSILGMLNPYLYAALPTRYSELCMCEFWTDTPPESAW